MTLYHKGESEYTTGIGAFLSIIVRIIVLFYAWFQLKSAIELSNWAIFTQTTSVNNDDLAEQVDFMQHSNFSIGIQLQPSLSQIEIQIAEYDRLTQLINSFSTVKMYTYSQRGLNHFSFVPGTHSLEYGPNSRAERVSWNELPQGDSFPRNSYNYSEIQIDLSKTTIMGSDSSFEPRATLFTAVQVEIDQIKIFNNVMEECEKLPICRAQLETEEHILKSYENGIIENPDGASPEDVEQRLKAFRDKMLTWQKPQYLSDFYVSRMVRNDSCLAKEKQRAQCHLDTHCFVDFETDQECSDLINYHKNYNFIVDMLDEKLYEVREAFEKISLSPVVYDEVEYFTDA